MPETVSNDKEYKISFSVRYPVCPKFCFPVRSPFEMLRLVLWLKLLAIQTSLVFCLTSSIGFQFLNALNTDRLLEIPNVKCLPTSLRHSTGLSLHTACSSDLRKDFHVTRSRTVFTQRRAFRLNGMS